MMGFDLGGLLKQYVSGAAPTADAATQFDEMARSATREVLSNALSEVFYSDATPPFSRMVAQMFAHADPQQQAGMLTRLLQGVEPSIWSSWAVRADDAGLGAILSCVMPVRGHASAQMNPQQAEQITPEQAEQLARQVERHNPGVVDTMSDYYADHPGLVKSLGSEVLGLAMAKMAQRD